MDDMPNSQSPPAHAAATFQYFFDVGFGKHVPRFSVMLVSRNNLTPYQDEPFLKSINAEHGTRSRSMSVLSMSVPYAGPNYTAQDGLLCVQSSRYRSRYGVGRYFGAVRGVCKVLHLAPAPHGNLCTCPVNRSASACVSF